MAGLILVVDDDMLMRRTLQALLEPAGFTVSTVGTVRDALAEVARRDYDLVLLDIVLPDGDGFTCCKQIRAKHSMPIVMLSTRRELNDRVTGLETGADDYIVKPFEPEEVVARVKAQLRRAQQLSTPAEEGEERPIRLGSLVVDPTIQDALVDGKPAGLTRKEFRLLYLLATRAGRAVSRDSLLDELWADDELSSDKNVAVYVRRLRQKIERDPDAPEYLVTVRGFGYKLTSVTHE